MPYATISDLPSYVRKLSTTKQKQWLMVFNATYIKHGEKKAFEYANGVVKKEKNK